MILRPEDIIKKLSDELGERLLDSSIRERYDGHVNKVIQKHLYLKIERDYLHRTVSLLREMTILHVACPMATKENEDFLELVYSFTLFFAEEKFKELPVMITVVLPKNDLRVRSCTDIVPGILIMEMEAQEMLGVLVEDIPDKRRFFTPECLEAGHYPLRKKFETKAEEATINE